MIKYIARRLILMIPTLVAISVISFAIIQAPPGDFVTSYVAELISMGDIIDQSEIEALRARYGLDRPIYVQYFKWINGILRGDLGRSLQWNKPVTAFDGERNHARSIDDRKSGISARCGNIRSCRCSFTVSG